MGRSEQTDHRGLDSGSDVHGAGVVADHNMASLDGCRQNSQVHSAGPIHHWHGHGMRDGAGCFAVLIIAYEQNFQIMGSHHIISELSKI